MKKLILLGLCFLFLIGLKGVSATNFNISNCTNLNTANSVYYLNATITNSTNSSCMNISANNVTLDCQGNLIRGNRYANYSIFINRTTQENTSIWIKNCYLDNWDTCLYIENAGRINVTNVSMTNCEGNSQDGAGLTLTTSNYNIFRNVKVNDSIAGSTIDCFMIRDSSYNIFTNISCYHPSYYGLFVEGTTYHNEFYNATLFNSSHYDFFPLPLYSDEKYCDNKYENITGTRGKIEYYNESVEISNRNFSSLFLCDADNSNITDVNVFGGNLVGNHDVTDDDVDVSRNNIGIGIYHSDNVTIDRVNVTGNMEGIVLRYSEYCVINNSFIGYTRYPNIQLHYADYNTITNTNLSYRDITDGSWISPAFTLFFSENNSIYNNYIRSGDIDNRDYVSNYGVIRWYGVEQNNFWNTSNQTGTRIYGSGTLIGGNYWTNSSNTGYSDTCTDSNNDGICDVAFNISSELAVSGTDTWTSMDYLSLSGGLDTAPTVTLNSPSDGYSSDDSANTYFNCTSIDPNGIQNISLYLTNSSSTDFSLNLTNTSSMNLNTFNVTYDLSIGSYIWNCYSCDTLGNCAFASANRTTSVSAEFDWAYGGFNFSVVNSRGITWNGSSFFVSSTGTDKVYEYNSSGNYTGFSFSVKTQESFPAGITWNGSSFFVTGYTEKVYEYNSSGNYTGFNFSIAETTFPEGITWNGSSFFVVSDGVYEYNSSGNYTGFTFSTAGEEVYPMGIAWNGSSFFTVGATFDTIYEYDKSGSYTGYYFNVSEQAGKSRDILWKNNAFYIPDFTTSKVYEYPGDDILPTTPTADTLTPNNPIISDELTGTCSGSTDADGDTITYHYRFYDITESIARQAFSTDNTYNLTSPDDLADQFRLDCRATTTLGNSPDRTGTDLETVRTKSIYEINTFSDGTTRGNLTFSSSVYKNLSIPYWAYITKAELDLKGYPSYCFQESANVSTDCGGIGTGKYYGHNDTCSGFWSNTSDIQTSPSHVWDGDYSSYAYCNGGQGYIYINYTKPLSAINSSLWQITNHSGAKGNLSINASCWNYNTDLLRLRIHSDGSSQRTFFQCWNTSDWINTKRDLTTLFVYEEAMWWNLYPLNVTIKTNNEITYQNLSVFNGTAVDIDLNASSLQDCVYACDAITRDYCNCTLNFTSATAGILEYSNIEIEYNEPQIDNCSVWNVTTLNVTFINFDSEAPINVTYKYSISHIFDTIYSNYSNSGTNNTNFSLCLSHRTINVTADIFIEYQNGSTLYTYYEEGLILDNTIQSIILRISQGIADITATVYDQVNNLFEGVFIKYLKWDVDTNNYKLMGTAKTNFEGKAILPLVQDTELYKFMLYYPFDTLRQTTVPTYITGTTILFQISTAEDVATDFHQTMDIDTRLTFSNVTNRFTWTYSDTNSLITQACLDSFKITAKGFNHSIDHDCLTTTSGVINSDVPRENGTTYCANAEVILNSEDWLIDSLCYTYASHDSNPAQFMGLLIAFIMTIAFAFAFKYSVELGVIALPLPLLFCCIMGIVDIATPIAVGIEIAAIVLAIILNKVID